MVGKIVKGLFVIRTRDFGEIDALRAALNGGQWIDDVYPIPGGALVATSGVLLVSTRNI